MSSVLLSLSLSMFAVAQALTSLIHDYVLRKLDKFKEIHADSSFMNTVETLMRHFSLPG